MKNILITGASGFLGRHLKNELTSDYNLILSGRHEGKDEYYLDLLSQDSIETFLEIIKNIHIDAVIHTAGRLVNGNMSIEEQMNVFEDNIKITRNMIKVIKRTKCETLINCSSIAVYPNEDGIFDEESKVKMSCNTECLYGLSKFCAENIFDYELQGECRIIHLRLAQIYGEGSREDRIFSIMKKSIVENNIIEVFGKGERISSFVSVFFVCKVVRIMLQNKDVKGIYNVGEENLSYKQLAERIKEKYGNENTIIKLVEKGSKKKFYLDTEKLDLLCKKG